MPPNLQEALASQTWETARLPITIELQRNAERIAELERDLEQVTKDVDRMKTKWALIAGVVTALCSMMGTAFGQWVF